MPNGPRTGRQRVCFGSGLTVKARAVGVTYSWYHPSHDVVLMRFETGFTWEQAFQAQDGINAMLEGRETPAAILLDFPGSTINLGHALANARTLLARRHPSVQKVILVSPAPATRALGTTFARFTGPFGHTFAVAASFEKAEAHLKQEGYMQADPPAE